MGIQSAENELRIVQSGEREREEKRDRVHYMQGTLLKARDKATRDSY